MELDRMSLPLTGLIVFGVLLLQLAFVGSYVGGLHDPQPHHIPVAIVGPDKVTAPVAEKLRAQAGDSVDVSTLPDRRAAENALRDRDIYAAYAPDPTGRTDTLLVARAASVVVANKVEDVAREATPTGRTLAVDDVVPLQESDPQGLSAFYLVVGWVVGGYLLSALLGLVRGMRPTSTTMLAMRGAVLVTYSLVAGILSAVLVGPVTHILDGHTAALSLLGFLVVLATSAATAAAESVLGIVGIGLAILAFVVLGNPSSGGPYIPELLPGFWRSIGAYLPPGAGTEAVRDTVYFSGEHLGRSLLILFCYVVAGLAVLVAASLVALRPRERAARHTSRHPRRAERQDAAVTASSQGCR